MSATTAIEWTDMSWNPVRGCSVVSAGCRNCYAMKQAYRFSGPGQPYEGLTYGPHWTGKIKLVHDALEEPLHWRKPRKIFVNSMSDLFHEDVPDEFIDRVFETICSCRGRHTFQILTKRPARMLEWCTRAQQKYPGWFRRRDGVMDLWNVWLGVSVEDQATADERIPLLLQTPAAVRFVSAEPLLGPMDVTPWLRATTRHHFRADVEGMLRHRSFDWLQHNDGRPMTRREAENELFSLHSKGVQYIPVSSCDAFDQQNGCLGHPDPRLDWVIVGGESGPGARSCDVAWVRSIKEQCQAAGVPCFVKQLGGQPFVIEGSRDAQEWSALGATAVMDDCGVIHTRDKKGGDPAEWPSDLRVREFPR